MKVLLTNKVLALFFATVANVSFFHGNFFHFVEKSFQIINMRIIIWRDLVFNIHEVKKNTWKDDTLAIVAKNNPEPY